MRDLDSQDCDIILLPLALDQFTQRCLENEVRLSQLMLICISQMLTTLTIKRIIRVLAEFRACRDSLSGSSAHQTKSVCLVAVSLDS
jgi:hypothetical protein